jgi:hypothetical protein
MKVSSGNRVADPRLLTLDYFTMTADVFASDSGAPVFDSQLRLVGVNARGPADHSASEGGCNVPLELPDALDAAAEQASYAAGALAALCEAEPQSEPCHTRAQWLDADGACAVSKLGRPTHASSILTVALALLAALARRVRLRRLAVASARLGSALPTYRLYDCAPSAAAARSRS